MTHATFDLYLTDAADPVIAIVTGEIDATNTADFVMAVDDLPGPRPLVVDLSDLTYMDSAGFAELDRMLARGAIVVVLPQDSALRKAAALIGLPCHDDVGTAVAAAGFPRR